MGVGLTGLAVGLRQGLSDFRQNMRAIDADERDARRIKMEEDRFKLEQERAGREGTRFGWEQRQEDERQRIRAAEEEYRQVDEMLRNGTILGARGAIQAPGAEQGQRNPFMTGAERYENPAAAMDAAYDMKAKALAKLYVAKGEYDKAEKVPEMMRALRQQQWSEKTGAAFAAMASGAPGATDAMAKIYSAWTDGWELDPTKGKFNPQTGAWEGLERVNDKGKREKFSLSQEQLAVGAMRFADPGALIKFSLERGDQAKKDRREDKKLDAEVRVADARVAVARDTAETNKTTRAANEAIRGRQEASATEERAQKLFRNSFGVGDFAVKTKDEVAELSDEGKQAYAQARQKHEISVRRSSAALGLWDLNDRKLSPGFIVSAIPVIEKKISAGARPDGVDPDGLPFLMINGQKVRIPKD